MEKFLQMNRLSFSSNLSEKQKQLWREETEKRLPASAPDPLIEACAICFSASSHLDRASQSFSQDIIGIWDGKLDQILAQAKQEFYDVITTPNTEIQDSEISTAIGRLRNRSHFAIALSELFDVVEFDTTLAALSDIAQTAVKHVVDYLLFPQSAEDSGWFILALGKLGAEELNYSSDLDLISFHLPETKNSGKDNYRPSIDYIACTKKLVALLSAHSAYGQGWRIDLRLRPDPSATAMSVSVASAVHYYQSKARSWERAAFIRARPIAGNHTHAQDFLDKIHSFIWRRNLDYTIIDDLAIMLQHKKASPDYLGFDLKIGAFSIRHIELFCHILQLLAGGRNPALQIHHTLSAFTALAQTGWLSPAQAEKLCLLYLSWRRLEHRLQYLQDAHTHSLPRNLSSLQDFACFAGFNTADELTDFIANLQEQTEAYSSHQTMDRLVSEQVQNDDNRHSNDANKHLSLHNHNTFTPTLRQLGFTRINDIQDTLAKWQAGEIQATRTEKARQKLDSLLQVALGQISSAADPDKVFFAFAAMLERLNAGAQLFALLAEHPHICRIVSESISQSDMILSLVSAHPELLDLWIEEPFFTPLSQSSPKSGSALLSPPPLHPEHIEQALDDIRIFKREVDIKAAMHLLHQISPHLDIARLLSTTAEQAIQKMAYTAQLDIERRYGTLEMFNFAIIGLGRVGASEMKLNSDLDLIFVYQGGAEYLSNGKITLGPTGYALKLAQRIVSYLSIASAQGNLYEVDLRLRPDGNAGPIAVHIERLASYVAHEAWPWEMIAYRKAKLIWQSHPECAAPDKYKHFLHFTEALKEQFHTLQPAKLISDLKAMVTRLKQLPPRPLDLKKRTGGLLYADFLQSIADHAEIELSAEALHHIQNALQSKICLEEIGQRLALTQHHTNDAEIYEWLGNVYALPEPEEYITRHCTVIATALNYVFDEVEAKN